MKPQPYTDDAAGRLRWLTDSGGAPGAQVVLHEAGIDDLAEVIATLDRERERAEKAEAERDTLRALLAETLQYLGDWPEHADLIDRIDAAMGA